MADRTLVRWHADYPEHAFDPTTKLGRGLCSCPGCEDAVLLVVERRIDRRAMGAAVVQHRGLCYTHAQTFTTGYWVPGLPVPEAD